MSRGRGEADRLEVCAQPTRCRLYRRRRAPGVVGWSRSGAEASGQRYHPPARVMSSRDQRRGVNRIAPGMLACVVAALVAVVAWPAVATARMTGAGGQPGDRSAPRSLEIESVDELLTALETVDGTIDRLSAEIQYVRLFELLGDRQERRGRLYFEAASGPEATHRFRVEFDQLRIGRRVEQDRQVYIFDGRWLVEKLPDERPPQLTKYELARPGQSFDPLRLGEGPLPIPIGQRRSDIESRFEASLLAAEADLDQLEADAPDASWRADIASLRQVATAGDGTYQLHLRRRPGWEADLRFVDIRLWYSRRTLLPRAARTVDDAGDVSIVLLAGVKLNASAEIPADAFDVTVPETGWDVVIETWRGGEQGDR